MAISYSLTDSAGGKFAINPTTGVVTTAQSNITAGSYSITVRATDSAGWYKDTPFTITVTASGGGGGTTVTLATLTLSPLTATAGSAYSGTISNVSSGSQVTATSSDGTTLTVSGTGTTRTVSGTFAAAGTKTISLVETLAGATGSPKTTTGISLVVSAASAATQAGPTLTSSSATYDSTGKFGASLNGGRLINSGPILNTNGPWTVEAWAKTSFGGDQLFVSQQTNFWIGIVSGVVKASYGNSNNGTVITLTSSVSTAADGAWHHYALVIDGANGVRLYVDGALAASDATTYASQSPLLTGDFAIRGFPDSTAAIWGGEVDELAVWSAAKYSATFTPPSAPYAGNETNLVAVWHLNNDGTSVKPA